MKIVVNNKQMETDEKSSLQALASALSLPDTGVAIAVNNQMIPRTQWHVHLLKENDQITVIKAACGG